MKVGVLAILIGFSSVSFAEPQALLIKFVAFEGSRCVYLQSSAALYIDKFSKSSTDVPWKAIRGSDLSEHWLELPYEQMPSASEDITETFRFYAEHSSTDADQYETDFHLTKEFFELVKAKNGLDESLAMTPVFHPEPHRSCNLKLRFLAI